MSPQLFSRMTPASLPLVLDDSSVKTTLVWSSANDTAIIYARKLENNWAFNAYSLQKKSQTRTTQLPIFSISRPSRVGIVPASKENLFEPLWSVQGNILWVFVMPLLLIGYLSQIYDIGFLLQLGRLIRNIPDFAQHLFLLWGWHSSPAHQMLGKDTKSPPITVG